MNLIWLNDFSLTPGFSPVLKTAGTSAVLTALRADGKTVETVSLVVSSAITGLKPGANENGSAPHLRQ